MGWFNRNKEKGEEKMTTLEQVRKAYEDLSEDDKKSFHQSIADRVHESIAAQERADGNEDSQTAEDREHEALGAEHAAGHGDVAELHEEKREENEREAEQDRRDNRQDDKQAEIRSQAEAWRKSAEERFSRIEAALEKLSGKSKLDNAREKYGLSSSGVGETTKRSFTDEDVRKLLG